MTIKSMTPTEIKKALYKEKLTAVKCGESYRDVISGPVTEYHYFVILGNGKRIEFEVPVSEMGENLFEDSIPAQLLIRWLA